MVLLHAKAHEKPEPPPRCNLHRRVLLQSCCLRLDELCRLSQGQAMETLRGRKKQGKLIHRKHKLVDGCRRLILEHEDRIISQHTDKHLDWHWQQARNEGTHALTYTDAFTHRHLLHTDPCTQRRFDTRKLLHTDVFTNTRFYTQTFLHTHAFTHRRFYTHTLLHTDAFTHRRFYTQTL